MKFAVNLPNGGECGHALKLAELAQLTESAGWDAVFLEDYIIWQGQNDIPTCDPWVALAAMAISTRSVRLGTTVTPIARRRPWKLARETVTLVKGPTRRALRWDGACLYKRPPDEDFTAKDVRDLVTLAQTVRDPGAPFDIVVGHAVWERAKDPGRERAYIASLAGAGATWWSQYIPPAPEDVMRQYVEEGTPRLA